MEKAYNSKLREKMVSNISEKGISVFELGKKLNDQMPKAVGKEAYERAKKEEGRPLSKMPPGFYECIGNLQDEGKIEIREHTVYKKH